MIGHQNLVEVDGVAILMLADLWPNRCEAVIVGVNPALSSVAVGHYHPGVNARLAMSRLRNAGLLPPSSGGYADDDALAVGVGFTDIAKRPTTSARGLTRRELDAGRAAPSASPSLGARFRVSSSEEGCQMAATGALRDLSSPP